MRWVRDLALLVVIAALVGGVVIHLRRSRDQEQMVQQAASEVLRMETELKYRSATRTTELNARGWPVTIDPKWFNESRPPINLLVSQNRPWVEVASADQAGLMHPRVRVAVEESLAAFWYNPYQGVVRARVPVMMNDDATLDVYNRVNACGLASLFWHEKPIPTPDIHIPTSTEQSEGAVTDAADDLHAQRDGGDGAKPDDSHSAEKPSEEQVAPVVVEADESTSTKP